MIGAAQWPSWRRWRCWRSSAGSPEGLRDAPAVAAQIVHDLHGAFDQLCRLVDFLDRLGAVRPGDHDAVAAADAVARDFVAQLLSVAIEKPDHRRQQRYNIDRIAIDGQFGHSSRLRAR